MSLVKDTNKIYLTYKARMVAEEKLRRYSKLANLMNIWYSFLMIVGSLAEATQTIEIRYYEVLFASASIAIFASSTFLVSGMLERKASDFRECYLELQKIWNSTLTDNEKLKRYGDSLARYPNHSPQDDADMRFGAWWRGAALYDTVGEAKLSTKSLIGIVLRKLAFWALISLVFFAPVYFAPSFVTLKPSV